MFSPSWVSHKDSRVAQGYMRREKPRSHSVSPFVFLAFHFANARQTQGKCFGECLPGFPERARTLIDSTKRHAAATSSIFHVLAKPY